MSGYSKSKQCEYIRIHHRLSSISAGEIPVVECGVTLYLSKNLESLSCNESPSVSCNPCLKVRMARSANPFVEGWYGADVTCTTPLSDKLLKLFTSKSGSIVSNNLLWKTMDCKYDA